MSSAIKETWREIDIISFFDGEAGTFDAVQTIKLEHAARKSAIGTV